MVLNNSEVYLCILDCLVLHIQLWCHKNNPAHVHYKVNWEFSIFSSTLLHLSPNDIKKILLNWGCIFDSESSHFPPTILFFNLLHIFSFIRVHFSNMQTWIYFRWKISFQDYSCSSQKETFQMLINYPVPAAASSLLSSPTTMLTDI